MDLSQLSALLYSGMDLNVDPCDNFNDYVCSKWLEKNPSVAEYITSWDTEDMTKLNSFQIIRDILERDDIVDEKSKLYYEKKYYEACIGTSLTQEREIYLEIFSETNCIERSWQDVVKYYAKMIGETFLFQIILDDSKNLNLVEPYKSRTNLNPYELFDFSLVDNFFEYRYKISSIKNNEYREPFLEFMKNINELVYNDGELPSNSYTVEEFQELYDSNCPSINFNSKINWTELLQLHAGGNKNFLHPAFKITINIDYFSELCKILSSTSSLTVVQYMQFNFEYSFDVFACLHKGIGKNTSPERNALSSKSYNCINHLPMTHGISEEIMNTQEFVKRKTYVQKLMKYLKPILIKEINNSWIDDEQKNYALDIIQEIQLNVVNFKQDSDRYYLEDTSISYKFEITDVAFKNLINFKKAQTVHKFKRALGNQNLIRDNKRQHVKDHRDKKNEFRRTKREIEMIEQYEEDLNAIMLSPSFLYAPHFHRKAPIAYNLGKMGYSFGHEMSHSFDIAYLSNNFETHWETKNPDLKNIFNDKKACLVKHFDKLGTDGTASLNENYADLAGLKVAFKMMRQMIDANPSLGKKTSHFERFNANKLFFISFANYFCEKPKVNNDLDHAPNALRLIGSLQNMKEFSEVFKCREDHFMNPKDKCDFWSNENLV